MRSGKCGGAGNCGQDVSYERRIYFLKREREGERGEGKGRGGEREGEQSFPVGSDCCFRLAVPTGIHL